MTNINAVYDLYDVLVDMLAEYEFDTECFERAGMDTHSQRDIILRSKEAIAKFREEPREQCYWEEDEDNGMD